MSETEPKLLQVGDKIIRSQYSVDDLETIIRVTAKRAYTKHSEFKREVGQNNYLSKIGKEAWGPGYWLGTLETIKKTQIDKIRRGLARGLPSSVVTNLDYEKLLRIQSIIDEAV